MSSTTTYQVSGMACGHCAQSVSTGIGGVAGVTDVHVDIASDAVTVTSAEALDIHQVCKGVEKADYEFVD